MSNFVKECLRQKSILITGGLGGIGQYVIGHLLDHSARVLISDILSDPVAAKVIAEAKWPIERCSYIRADVTKACQAEALVERAVSVFGQVDVALCHAGVVRSCPILDLTEREWNETLDLNLKGAFLVAQAAARSMVKQMLKGKIIFTSSWVQDVPWPGITPYTVSKSGMKALMRGMARELAPNGIRVNAVAPGIVAAGMAKHQWDSDADYRRRAEKAIPLGFMQPPQSVADAFIFLCSDASDYMTGATLLVDGGCSLYPMD